MKSSETMIYQPPIKNQTDNRSSEELFESIVNDIRKKYDGKLSNIEAHQAARNLIEFVKILLKYHEQSN